MGVEGGYIAPQSFCGASFFMMILICVLPLHCGFWAAFLRSAPPLAKGGHVALRSAVVLRLSPRVLAPLLAAAAAAWLPPAAKEG